MGPFSIRKILKFLHRDQLKHYLGFIFHLNSESKKQYVECSTYVSFFNQSTLGSGFISLEGTLKKKRNVFEMPNEYKPKKASIPCHWKRGFIADIDRKDQ